MRRRALAVAAAVALIAVVAVGLSQTKGQNREGPSRLKAAAHNRLLPGGKPAFDARLRSLRGRPVVVNLWASWCGPCRAEFPFFQTLASKLHRRVTFLGVNTTDATAPARDFLRRFPVPYPSFFDRQGAVASAYAVQGLPDTVFFTASGKRTVHQGGYASEAILAQDITRYALGS